MPFFQLTDQLYISSQINSKKDAEEAVALGIQTIICNRPNGEEPNQPTFTEVSTWFSESGICNLISQPVSTPDINLTDAQTFNQALTNNPGPILAYCRTGTRCSILWALSQIQKGTDAAECIAEIKQKTGLDLTHLEAKLQNLQ